MKNFSIQSIYNWYRGLLQNPKYRWWVVAGSLVYLVSPLDISPDIFPVVGWIDDSIIIGLLTTEVFQIVKAKLEERSVRTNKTTEPVADTTVDVNAVPIE
jgi:uncharacterized membrane protein YkvA (DUF1232 family)